jgi:heme oxygenase (biliverdin-IX-beta and delta-forming)
VGRNEVVRRQERDGFGGDLLTGLRTASATEHARLETSTRLPEAAREPGHYACALRAFLDVVGPLEATLAAVASSVGVDALVPGPRAALLRHDLDVLARLGHDPAGVSTVATPVAIRSAIPEPDDVPGVLGCAYVLEGSRLGGMVIAPVIEARLGLSPGDGTAFLRGGGVDAGRSWHRFRQEVSGIVARYDGSLDGASEAAVATFRSFRLAMQARTERVEDAVLAGRR